MVKMTIDQPQHQTEESSMLPDEEKEKRKVKFIS